MRKTENVVAHQKMHLLTPPSPYRARWDARMAGRDKAGRDKHLDKLQDLLHGVPLQRAIYCQGPGCARAEWDEAGKLPRAYPDFFAAPRNSSILLWTSFRYTTP